jgi:hypothetical protein
MIFSENLFPLFGIMLRFAWRMILSQNSVPTPHHVQGKPFSIMRLGAAERRGIGSAWQARGPIAPFVAQAWRAVQ